MKTFVTIAQQMLNGEITMDEAAEEMTQLTPPKPVYDIDGMYYDGEEDNTIGSMMLLGMDKDTGKIDPQIKQQIRKLFRTYREKRKAQ